MSIIFFTNGSRPAFSKSGRIIHEPDQTSLVSLQIKALGTNLTRQTGRKLKHSC